MTFASSLLMLLVILLFQQQGSTNVLDPGCLRSDMPMIINGRNADRAPWMAYLHRNGEYQCGGSLVTSHLVLTAAHCATSRNDLSVRLGEYDSSTQDDQTIDIPIYNYFTGLQTNTHDIIIFELSEQVTYSAYIRPICILLPDFFPQLPAVNNFILTGWGRTSRTSRDPSPVLQEMTLERMDPSKCPTPEGQICCQNPTQNSCHGDSGSPLVAFVKYNETTTIAAQYGVLSHGHERCFDHGYYVDVNHLAYYILAADLYKKNYFESEPSSYGRMSGKREGCLGFETPRGRKPFESLKFIKLN